MSAVASAPVSPAAPARRFAVTPLVKFGVIVLAVAIAVTSYATLRGNGDGEQLISPWLIALLLLANLVPGVALMILFGRRIARRRAARAGMGGEGRLHVRLVAIFSVMAAVPMALVAISASLLFQLGIDFWSSDRARSMIENSSSLVRENYQREIDRVALETQTMAGDLANYLRTLPVDSKEFSRGLVLQTYNRNLSEAMIVERDSRDPLVVLNPYGRPLQNVVTPQMMARLDAGQPVIKFQARDRAAALVPLSYDEHAYLYAARVFDEQIANQLKRGDAIVADYRALRSRARALQLQFNIALLLVSLLIVGVAVWIALAVADRLVSPVGELVDAARRVEAGDLAARVSERHERDEVGTLSHAFNRMTGRLEEQNTALVTANAQLENRRALIEAVMSGVSAGVVSIASDRTVRLINASAQTLLGLEAPPIGRTLGEIAPELDALLDGHAREAIVQVSVGGEQRTLAVRIARDGTGPILTFDDITQQLLDQRRAAWSDVARRIAHEIKNPLTPIQLAAERLQRRYGGKVEEGDTTFGRLTDTIVRQVADLRRMVDEFSSFARMPKPVFKEETLVDIARQTMFLHEVAHGQVSFVIEHDDPGPSLVCDRRQIGQALTNIVKNAVEAIEAKGGDHEALVEMRLSETPTRVTIEVGDTGVGLPVERDRIVEPYMTTRARGTGLGLAIVKKIVEEHFGTIAFSDRPAGGTLVTMTFDTTLLAALDIDTDSINDGDGGPLAALTRHRS